MVEYKLYCLDGDGHIARPPDRLRARDDNHAL